MWVGIQLLYRRIQCNIWFFISDGARTRFLNLIGSKLVTDQERKYLPCCRNLTESCWIFWMDSANIIHTIILTIKNQLYSKDDVRNMNVWSVFLTLYVILLYCKLLTKSEHNCSEKGYFGFIVLKCNKMRSSWMLAVNIYFTIPTRIVIYVF